MGSSQTGQSLNLERLDLNEMRELGLTKKEIVRQSNDELSPTNGMQPRSGRGGLLEDASQNPIVNFKVKKPEASALAQANGPSIPEKQ